MWHLLMPCSLGNVPDRGNVLEHWLEAVDQQGEGETSGQLGAAACD